MNRRLVFSLVIMVVVLVAGALLLVLAQAPAPAPQPKPAAFALVGANTVNPTEKIQLRLSVNASYSGGQNGNVTVFIKVDEYNTLQDIYNDVPTSSSWSLSGLSMGSCGDGIYPFGVALYAGYYTAGNSSIAGNVTEATPLPIYPNIPCPQVTQLITGYVFNPGSNFAVVLPNPSNSSAVQIGSNVTANTVYRSGVSSSSGITPTKLGPGTYTVAAGDEWGSVVTVSFTFGGTSSSSSAAVDPQLALMSLVLALLPASALSPYPSGLRQRGLG